MNTKVHIFGPRMSGKTDQLVINWLSRIEFINHTNQFLGNQGFSIPFLALTNYEQKEFLCKASKRVKKYEKFIITHDQMITKEYRDKVLFIDDLECFIKKQFPNYAYLAILSEEKLHDNTYSIRGIHLPEQSHT